MKNLRFWIISSVLVLGLAAPPLIVRARGDVQTGDNNQQDQTTKLVQDERRQDEPSLNQDAKQQRCQRRQAAVDHRVGVINSGLKRRLEFLDAIFERVDNFVKAKNLEVENYEQLRAKVVDAQTNAKTVIDNLAGKAPQLSCDKDQQTGDIVEFRTDAMAARQALVDYKKVLRHEYLEAVRQVVRKARQEGKL